MSKLHSGQLGFSLLEAIVAVAIIGMTLVPLLELFDGSVSSLIAVHRGSQRAQAEQNALAALETINPTATPVGEMPIGAYTLSWRAELMAPLAPGTSYPNGNGLFDLGLYRTFVTISDFPGANVEFEIHQVGYVRSRQQLPNFQ